MSEPESTQPEPSNRWLTRGVLGIGLASLFSDWGHEAATSILPAFLASLGAPAIALGIIEGISDGFSSFAKLAGGWIADRPQWRKPTGIIGYLATGLSTFGYAFAHSWPAILVMRGLGWIGTRKPGAVPGYAAGGFRAAAAGGPRLRFRAHNGHRGSRSWAPLRHGADRSPRGTRRVAVERPARPARGCGLRVACPAREKYGGASCARFCVELRSIAEAYWHYLAGVFAHGIGDFAPTLLILRANQILTPRFGFGRAATISVGLYTFYNVVNAMASYPAGALGDRIGKRGLLAAGYLVGVIAYAGFIFEPPTIPILAALFGLAGIHGGFQQSLEKALGAELLPSQVRGSGFGVLATANGIGDLDIEHCSRGAVVRSEPGGRVCLRRGVRFRGRIADLQLAVAGGNACLLPCVCGLAGLAGSAGKNGCCVPRRSPGG
jgi:MFS family permease